MLHNAFINSFINPAFREILFSMRLIPLFTTSLLIILRVNFIFLQVFPRSKPDYPPKVCTSLEELSFPVNSRHHKNNCKIDSNFSCDMRGEKIILCMNFLSYRVYSIDSKIRKIARLHFLNANVNGIFFN